MTNAVGYRLRISRNPYISSTLVDKKLNTAAVTITNPGEGLYYWGAVLSRRGEGLSGEREERFHIISPGTTAQAIVLELDLFLQHGHVIELKGNTEKGARVVVKGSKVPMVSSDRQFYCFTPPLPPGEAMISATAQRAQGGVNTQQKKLVIQ